MYVCMYVEMSHEPNQHLYEILSMLAEVLIRVENRIFSVVGTVGLGLGLG